MNKETSNNVSTLAAHKAYAEEVGILREALERIVALDDGTTVARTMANYARSALNQSLIEKRK